MHQSFCTCNLLFASAVLYKVKQMCLGLKMPLFLVLKGYSVQSMVPHSFCNMWYVPSTLCENGVLAFIFSLFRQLTSLQCNASSVFLHELTNLASLQCPCDFFFLTQDCWTEITLLLCWVNIFLQPLVQAGLQAYSQTVRCLASKTVSTSIKKKLCSWYLLDITSLALLIFTAGLLSVGECWRHWSCCAACY